MVAACLRLYPTVARAHGSAARIMQYRGPGPLPVDRDGCGVRSGRISSASLRNRSLRLACLGLIVVGVVPLVEGFRHPVPGLPRRGRPTVCSEVLAGGGPGGRGGLSPVGSGGRGVGFDPAWGSPCRSAIRRSTPRPGGTAGRGGARSRPTAPLRCVLGVGPEADPREARVLDRGDERELRDDPARVDLRRHGRARPSAEPGAIRGLRVRPEGTRTGRTQSVSDS